MDTTPTSTSEEKCPRCGMPLSEEITTATGKKLRRCTGGTWNPETRTTDGCTFIKWLPTPPVTLDEKCPQCGAPLVLAMTRYGKKLKRCSTNQWDKVTRTSTGCSYVEWISGSTKALDEKCPQCGANLVLYTTATGKKLKKCSTAGWDKEKRQPTGCDFVYWFKAGEAEAMGVIE